MHHHQAIASDSTTIPPGAFNAELVTYRSLVNNDSRRNQNGNPRNRDSDYDSLLDFPKSEDGEDTRPGDDDRRRRLKSWGWELSSCVLSLASFFAIIAVLFFENGKPLEQWSWRIGPTAVVSFITTIAKSSMLLAVAEVIGQLKWNHFHGRARPIMDLQTFDSAGRGPLGAAVFVGKNHIRTLFASIAAMVVVLSLLVDPFMQLIFAFPTHSRHDTGLTASFKSATIYDPHSSFYNPNRFGPSLTDSKMQSAIISTIGGQTTPPIAMCTSGNCTWASIATLGVCSACMNVTLQIEVECPRDESANLSRCYYTFPSGGNLSAVAFTPGGAGAEQPTRWNSSATVPPSLVEGSPMENETAALATFNAIQIVGDGSSTALLQNPIAWQCALAFCEKIYRNVTAENGLVRFPASDQGILSIMEGNACDETQCYTLKTNSSPPLTTYKVNTQDYVSLATYLVELFSYSWIAMGVRVPDSDQQTGATTPNLGWQFATIEDLGQTVSDIAYAMTEVIRNGPNSTSVAGDAFSSKVYIEVRWGWIALPFTLIVVSTALVIVMVLQRSQGDAPAWKNSTLALLLYDVPSWTPTTRVLEGKSVLEKEAQKVSVKLSDNVEDLRFE